MDQDFESRVALGAMHYAVEKFLTSTMVAILETSNEQGIVNGSGVLAQFKNRYYVLTATHIFDFGRNPSEFAISITKSGILDGTKVNVIKFAQLNDAVIYRHPESESDICLVDITAIPDICHLIENRTFIDISDITVIDRDKLYVITGFPNELIFKDKSNIGITPVAVQTRIKDDFNPNWSKLYDVRFHHALKHSKEGNVEGGGRMELPKLAGVSGAPVWQIYPNVQGFWDASKNMKLVGIQFAVRPGEYILFSNARNVLDIIKQFDSNLPIKGD